MILMRILDVMGEPIRDDRPHYLRAFDVDAMAGIGTMKTTTDFREAMQFADARACAEAWRTQSKVRPLREDGKPNRPLTACSIEFISLATAIALEGQPARTKA